LRFVSPPQPAGLRTRAGAVFGSFKKYASHFLNSAFGGTEPNKAPYTGTDKFNRSYLSGINRYHLRNNLRLDVELLKLTVVQKLNQGTTRENAVIFPGAC